MGLGCRVNGLCSFLVFALCNPTVHWASQASPSGKIPFLELHSCSGTTVMGRERGHLAVLPLVRRC